MKKLVALVMSVLLIGSLGACKSNSTTTPAPTTGAEAPGGSAETPPAGGGASTGGVVKIICPYGVGGTADAIARKYALVAGKLYPQYNFIVENQTGGDGFQAATTYTNQPETTKDLLVFGYGVAYRHDLGKKYETEIVEFDRTKITPVATIDDRNWVLYAAPGVTLEDVIAKSKTDAVKMSGGNPLSDPHLALGSLLAIEGGKVKVVPYDGGANQKKALSDGEVDVFVGTTQAAKDEVEAGTLIPILAFSDGTFKGFIDPSGPIEVPGIMGEGKAAALNPSNDYSGCILPAGGFIAARTGADQAWIDEVVTMSKAVWADTEYTEWIASILLNKYEVYGDDAKAHLDAACEKAIKAFEELSK